MARRGTLAAATLSPGQFPYEGAGRYDLPEIGWAVVYNVNDPVGVATDPSVYGGRFVQPSRRGSGCDEPVDQACAPSLKVT